MTRDEARTLLAAQPTLFEVWGYTRPRGQCATFKSLDRAAEWAAANRDSHIELAVFARPSSRPAFRKHGRGSLFSYKTFRITG